jgi:hypothetical protein
MLLMLGSTLATSEYAVMERVFLSSGTRSGNQMLNTTSLFEQPDGEYVIAGIASVNATMYASSEYPLTGFGIILYNSSFQLYENFSTFYSVEQYPVYNSTKFNYLYEFRYSADYQSRSLDFLVCGYVQTTGFVEFTVEGRVTFVYAITLAMDLFDLLLPQGIAIITSFLPFILMPLTGKKSFIIVVVLLGILSSILDWIYSIPCLFSFLIMMEDLKDERDKE